ncbi:hypothetical protein AB0C34_01740 [Nocardia sp. NPDC049220]|uniref:hypothetical protein n=1 Tax=Nocardia sp. NPDC049220 TaxID=3155273 RepID=UPI00340E0B20
MKVIWMAVPALVAVIVTGCSDDPSASRETTSTSAVVAASSVSAPPDTHDDGAEVSGVVRILLGETKQVPVPPDVVLDIRVPVAWGEAANDIRCTAIESSGRNEDLRSSDVRKTETVGGTEWMTLWTFSSAPIGDVTVGCNDMESRIAAAHPDSYIRVVARGVAPAAPQPVG